MAADSSISGIAHFQDIDRESGKILSRWLERSGVRHQTILEELKAMEPSTEAVGPKSFRQWIGDVESAKRISGPTPEIKGDRVVAIVQWFVREHRHRQRKVIEIEELGHLIQLYPDIPVRNRLQLRRILHELQIESSGKGDELFAAKGWRDHFAQWPIFAFVTDRLWCLRATTRYNLELVGFREEDMQEWKWWHRLTTGIHHKTKFADGSSILSLRGPYAEAYYRQQIARFRRDTEMYRQKADPRYEALIALLHNTPNFTKWWGESCRLPDSQLPKSTIPVPFFRPDGTLLWMLEVSAVIPDSDDYQLTMWTALDEESQEYLAEIRRQADRPGKYKKTTYFIEEYVAHFGKNERFAFGLDERMAKTEF